MNKLHAYTISFCQGGVIMGYEILTPKMIAPAFGTSLYVWGCSLVFTMAGLAGGYFYSSRVTSENNRKAISLALIFAALFIAAITLLSSFINSALLGLSIKPGIAISSFSHLFPVLFCLGMISPLLINELSGSSDHGKNTGMIFGSSTVAGIVLSLVTGFYLIPEKGLVFSSLLLVLLLLTATAVCYSSRRKNATE